MDYLYTIGSIVISNITKDNIAPLITYGIPIATQISIIKKCVDLGFYTTNKTIDLVSNIKNKIICNDNIKYYILKEEENQNNDLLNENTIIIDYIK